MRAITHVTIKKDCMLESTSGKPYDVFLEYNNDSSDYSFNSYATFNAALQSIPLDSSYFPLEAKEYTLKISDYNGKTVFNERIKF